MKNNEAEEIEEIEEEEEEEEKNGYSFQDIYGDNLLDFETKHIDLDLYGYNEVEDRWKIVDPFPEPIPFEIDSLKIATQNIWFDEFNIANRSFEQLNTFELEKPHIICLQEVCNNYLYEFRIHEEMKQNYLIADNPHDVQTFRRYGSQILIRKDLIKSISKVIKLTLPSGMGRSFINCDLLLQSKGKNKENFKMNIGSIHLESMNNDVCRRSQLRLISDSLQANYSESMICGDFNFDSKTNFYPQKGKLLENGFLTSEEGKDLKNYIDIWPFLKKKSEPGYTIDYEKNKMLSARKNRIEGKREGKRYDRMLYKGKKFIPVSVKLINNFDIDMSEITFHSDHFGVCTVLEIL